MRTSTRVAFAAASALALAGSSCEKKTGKNIEFIYLVTGTSALDLQVQYSNGATDTCAGANSYLLRINTSDGGAGWDYTFLFDATRTTLYGCSGADLAAGQPEGGACLEPTLGFNLAAPKRVMIEGLSVMPAAYVAATSGIDVICRGIADDAVVDADIETTTVAVPTAPVPEPTTTTNTVHDVVVRVLRVGDSNALPFGAGAPPDTRYGAAAGFSSVRDGLGLDPTAPGAGHVVLAGGKSGTNAVLKEVWELDPQTLTFTATTSLGVGRAGLTASTFADGAETRILFAGGSEGTSVKKSRAADVYAPDGHIESVALALGTARAFHSATYFPRPTTGAVIGVLGGGDYDPSTDAFGGGETGTSEYFLPKNVTANGCAAMPVWRFCVPTGSNSLTVARLRHGAPLYLAPGPSTLAWVAGGQTNMTGTASGQTYTAGNIGTFAGTVDLASAAVAPITARITSSGNAVLDGRPIFVGGYLNGGANLSANNSASFLDGAGTTLVVADTMIEGRGDATGTVLRDKTLLIAGGRNQANPGVLPFERLVPTTESDAATAADFELIPGPAASSCTGGAGCAALRTPRFGHTATRLDATNTWLDGSVLIAGGGGGSAAPELFVPALLCGGAQHDVPKTPVLLQDVEPLSNPTLAPLCDRDRRGGPIDNPKLVSD